ncbi:hypothetical protein HOA55_03495 [archaeon]|jgi:hypothetical protein|nr:hypothetical protein [archaeon]MBT3577363.1 hypothetical protein [archaeon]MBT6820394.1 hypothetical protein [archaeon]MBT6955751.1 hypothetical protein [archaeon]MBT7025208.1 hypothetical protein [archaeon]
MGYGFCFDNSVANDYLKMFKECAEAGVFPQDTLFALRENSQYGGTGIVSLVPELDEKRIIGERERVSKSALSGRILGRFGQTIGRDFKVNENWAGGKDGKIYFYDLHLTDQIDLALETAVDEIKGYPGVFIE